MIENMEEEIKKEEFEIKEENISIKEEVFPHSTVEDTCNVYIQEDIKMENTGFQGNEIYC